MIQDIGAHLFDNGYIPDPPREDDVLLAFSRDRETRGQVIVSQGEAGLVLPTLRDWERALDDTSKDDGSRGTSVQALRTLAPRMLFSIDRTRFYLVEGSLGTEPLRAAVAALSRAGFVPTQMNLMRYLRPRHLAFAAITARQLARWYELNHYCGRCGAELGHVTTSRELACPSCQNVVYPRLNPAVIVGITNGDKLLLTKYAHGYDRYALVAGFCEVGETLEQTVAREVREEVDLDVCNLRYYASQPWPFTDSLLAGFFCDVAGDPSIHVDGEELRLGEWWSRDDLPKTHEDTSSLTNRMIEAFARGEV